VKLSQRTIAIFFPIAALLLLTAWPAVTPRSRTAPPVAAVAVAESTPSATATALPPSATPTLARREYVEDAGAKIAPTAFLPGKGPTLPGTFVTSTRRLDFYVGGGSFSSAQVAEMAIKAEHALSYIQRRFAEPLDERVSVGVYSRSASPGRGTRGIAYTSGNNVRIYYSSGEDSYDALVILSHELAHALQAHTYGDDVQSRADTILLEGLATWISGEYWLSLSGAPSFQARARQLYAQGWRGSLTSFAGAGNSVAAYEMWAGFVEYLANTYGWDTVNMLYASGRGRAAGSSDYRGIYGKSLVQLQNEWYATLK
jgi:hypothetical protein